MTQALRLVRLVVVFAVVELVFLAGSAAVAAVIVGPLWLSGEPWSPEEQAAVGIGLVLWGLMMLASERTRDNITQKLAGQRPLRSRP